MSACVYPKLYYSISSTSLIRVCMCAGKETSEDASRIRLLTLTTWPFFLANFNLFSPCPLSALDESKANKKSNSPLLYLPMWWAYHTSYCIANIIMYYAWPLVVLGHDEERISYIFIWSWLLTVCVSNVWF